MAFTPLLVIGLSIAACSSGSDTPDGSASSAAAIDDRGPSATGSSLPEPVKPAQAAPVAKDVLTLEGLGDLQIGKALPSTGSWAERGAQASDSCRTVMSPDYPGVYAIVNGGKVRRVTVGQRSEVKLIEGIGVGSTENDVGKWFAGFRAEPHKYVVAPAKYLTAPNASSGDPALRFEIGSDEKVSLMHIGLMPELAYVEGCS